MGLMIGVELVKDRETKERANDWRDQVIHNAFQKGLLLLGCGQNTIRICPALPVSRNEIDVFLNIFQESLREIFN
jgi:4-aminobutyrate aminotransferase